MYISHKYKICFVRIPKTACSSITEYLIRNIPDHEAVHSGVDDVAMKSTLGKNPIRRPIMANKYVHYTLQDIVKDGFIKENQLKDYTIFGVIRDPVDRQMSMYYFRKKWDRKTKPSLQDYKNITINNCAMKINPDATGKIQTDFLTYKGQPYGKFLLFDNIEEELDKFMKARSMPTGFKLPKHKSGNRKPKQSEIVFDDEVLNSIKMHYTKDYIMYNQLKEQK
jgi:hypothetical protein